MMHLRQVALIFCLSLLHSHISNAQERPFSAGETLHYKSIYIWGFIWIEAGEVDFSVAAESYMGNPCYVLKSSGQSLPSYDWIFKVRDSFVSVVDSASFKPYLFTKQTNEGGFKVWNSYNFNYKTNKLLVNSETSKRSRRADTLALKPNVFDVLTGVYYARSLDYSNYTTGQRIYINLAIDNEIYTIYGRFLGREKLTLRDGREFNTLKFSVLLVEGTIFKGGEDLLVWISDDQNRIPVMVEANILVGKVKAVLVSAHGLRHRMTSLITPASPSCN